MFCASNEVGGSTVVSKLTDSLVMVFSSSPFLLAVTAQRYWHERGAASAVSATYVAPVAPGTSPHSSPVALSCH